MFKIGILPQKKYAEVLNTQISLLKKKVEPQSIPWGSNLPIAYPVSRVNHQNHDTQLASAVAMTTQRKS